MNLAVPLLLIIIALQVEPVEVFADEARSVVARHHSIRVDHRNDLEDQAVSQVTCTLRYQEVYHAVQDPGRIGFSRVDAPAYYDCALLADVDHFICDRQQRYLQSSKRPRQGRHLLV